MVNMNKIEGSKAFSVPTRAFAISPSSTDYTLQFSADGVHFTSYAAATPAGETLMVVFGPKNVIWRLLGNNDTLTLTY